MAKVFGKRRIRTKPTKQDNNRAIFLLFQILGIIGSGIIRNGLFD